MRFHQFRLLKASQCNMLKCPHQYCVECPHNRIKFPYKYLFAFTFKQRVSLIADGAKVPEFARLSIASCEFTVVPCTVTFVNDFHVFPLPRLQGLVFCSRFQIFYRLQCSCFGLSCLNVNLIYRSWQNCLNFLNQRRHRIF